MRQRVRKKVLIGTDLFELAYHSTIVTRFMLNKTATKLRTNETSTIFNSSDIARSNITSENHTSSIFSSLYPIN
jgi:hypothetical protein